MPSIIHFPQLFNSPAQPSPRRYPELNIKKYRTVLIFVLYPLCLSLFTTTTILEIWYNLVATECHCLQNITTCQESSSPHRRNTRHIVLLSCNSSIPLPSGPPPVLTRANSILHSGCLRRPTVGLRILSPVSPPHSCNARRSVVLRIPRLMIS